MHFQCQNHIGPNTTFRRTFKFVLFVLFFSDALHLVNIMINNIIKV